VDVAAKVDVAANVDVAAEVDLDVAVESRVADVESPRLVPSGHEERASAVIDSSVGVERTASPTTGHPFPENENAK
ncbi:MAG: hypothetical protein ABI831_20700, partial [Betaproteobacteria bacterium]